MTLGSILLLANNMMTKESIEKLKKKDNTFEPEVTIKLKYKTIEALIELSRHNNDEVYDQIIMRLIRAYNKKGMVE